MSLASPEPRVMASPTYSFLSSRKRYPLVAALMFVEGVGGGHFGHEELVQWIERYLVGTGWMPWPNQVQERLVGAIPLGDAGDPPVVSDHEVDVVLSAARTRILAALRGFLGKPSNDRFLNAAIHGGRVQRDSRGMMTGWVPRPHIEDSLSDVVLSLFAADILGHREAYERSLAVCDRCDKVSFDPSGVERPMCSCQM